MNENNSYPLLNSEFVDAKYCVEINGTRLVLFCSRFARFEQRFTFGFSDSHTFVRAGGRTTGELHLLSDSFKLVENFLNHRVVGWIPSINIQIWSKLDLGMARTIWTDEETIQSGVLSSMDYWSKDLEHLSDYHRPEISTDVKVFNIDSIVWGHAECGQYRAFDQFYTELSEDLVLVVVFNVASCWPRDTLPPPGLKEHLMPFFLDYLSHVQIIDTTGVPESELPPLGFYPFKREEKELDAEGRVVEPEAEAKPFGGMGW